MCELAAIEVISRPSVTGIISRLVDQDLVHQRPHDEDDRCSMVAITTEGVDTLEKGRQARTAFLAKHLENLSEDELDALDRVVWILDGMVGEA